MVVVLFGCYNTGVCNNKYKRYPRLTTDTSRHLWSSFCHSKQQQQKGKNKKLKKIKQIIIKRSLVGKAKAIVYENKKKNIQ